MLQGLKMLETTELEFTVIAVGTQFVRTDGTLPIAISSFPQHPHLGEEWIVTFEGDKIMKLERLDEGG